MAVEGVTPFQELPSTLMYGVALRAPKSAIDIKGGCKMYTIIYRIDVGERWLVNRMRGIESHIYVVRCLKV